MGRLQSHILRWCWTALPRYGLGVVAAMLGSTASSQTTQPANGSSTGTESSEFPLGLTWVVNGGQHSDDTSYVDGGVEHSCMLVIERPSTRQAWWVLIEGEYLYLKRPDQQKVKITDQCGQFGTSEFPGIIHSGARTINTMRLTGLLLRHYRVYGADTLRRVPFLTGPWGPTKADGATWPEAERAIQRLDLTPVRAFGSPTNGRTKTLVPQSGTVLPKGAVVVVTLDGSATPTPSAPGDKTTDAILVDKLDQPFSGRVTLMHDNDLPLGSAKSEFAPFPTDGDEVFFKLDSSFAGKRLLVARTDAQPAGDDALEMVDGLLEDRPVLLSVWVDSGSGQLAPLPLDGQSAINWAYGVQPSLAFTVPAFAPGPGAPRGSCYVAAEVGDFGLGAFQLTFRERPAGATQKHEQKAGPD